MLEISTPRLPNLFFRRSSQVPVPLKVASSSAKRRFGQPIEVNWAYASAQREDTSNNRQETRNEDTPENNPQYTTVYVGNLAPEVTPIDLHCHFQALGVGVIEDVRIQRDKGFGFIRYSSHAEAASAIQMGNARILFGNGKLVKCSWGSKPTPPRTSSTPLPPPAVTHMPSFTAADLSAYERQLALSKMTAVQTLMNPQGQRLGAASQAIYHGG